MSGKEITYRLGALLGNRYNNHTDDFRRGSKGLCLSRDSVSVGTRKKETGHQCAHEMAFRLKQNKETYNVCRRNINGNFLF